VVYGSLSALSLTKKVATTRVTRRRGNGKVDRPQVGAIEASGAVLLTTVDELSNTQNKICRCDIIKKLNFHY
jgi:hypothetical protein